MECGHIFCRDCYSGHVHAMMSQGPEAVMATCPMQGCKLIIPESIFREVLDENMFKRYKYYFIKSYIDK